MAIAQNRLLDLLENPPRPHSWWIWARGFLFGLFITVAFESLKAISPPAKATADNSKLSDIVLISRSLSPHP